jgi:pimeloyl-ACP methyl ester carboxylesterase
VFDGLQAQLAANRSQFYRDLPAGPFYGFNRPGAKVSEGVIQNWWRQGMMGGAKAHYDGIVAFSQTDFTEDLKKITVPVLVMHGDDDQIVPYADSGPLVGQAAEERHAENLQGLSARHADHRSRHDQRGPAGLHQAARGECSLAKVRCRTDPGFPARHGALHCMSRSKCPRSGVK